MIRAKGSITAGGINISPDIRPLALILWWKLVWWLWRRLK